MKTARSVARLALFAVVAVSATTARLGYAIDYFWDSNSTTAGFGNTNGTWGTSTFISTSSAGTAATANTATTTSDLLNIGTSTDGYTGGRTITVSTTRNIGSITVGSATTGGNLILSGGTAINLGGTATITNNSSNILDIQTPITGSAGLVKAGSGNILLGGTSTFTGNISITGGVVQMQGTTATLGSGNFTGTMAIDAGASFVYNGPTAQILSGIISGAGSVQLAGANTLTLTQNNTFTGDTVIIGGFVNARLGVNSNLALQNSALNTGSATSGRLIMGTGVTTPTLGGLKGSVALGTVVITNYNLITALTLNPGSGFSPSYSGVIANGAAGMTLTKTGLGTQTLSGNNTYSGATTISAGTLHFATTGALYNNAPASWTAANIRVQNGGTIGLNVGGTNEFSTGNITTLLTNLASSGNATNGMNAGSRFAFDTTNASGGTFTIANVIADSIGASGGARGVTKQGTGILVLSGNSTYSGTTAVNAGTLRVNGAHTGGGAYSVAASGTLGGTGSTTAAVSVTGVLSPGASIETFQSGALTFNDTSTFAYEVDSSVALSVGADLQLVTAPSNTGNLTIANGVSDVVTLTLTDLAGSPVAFANGTTFSLINYDGTWNGGLFNVGASEIADGGTFMVGNNTWQLDYNATSGGSNFSGQYLPTSSFVNIVAVPEPGTLALLACGGAIGAAYLRRRSRGD